MFPTFISIIDIQSWWEVPSIAHFCSLFRTAFNLLDFDIEDLEEALLTDGTEESSWLQELIVRLLSGCLPNNEISTFNYQMFLRRLFRQKCQEHDRYNPFNTDIDFQLLPLRTKVDILHALCDFRLDADDVLDQLKNLEADSLRVEPLGYDSNDSAYWYFYGTRLYREDFTTKNNKKKSVWQVICFTEDDWFQLTKKFKKSTSKVERQLYQTLSENFLPELPRLFKEKENLARKRLLENQPRRTSNRLRKLECETEKEEADRAEQAEKSAHEHQLRQEEEERIKKRDLENRRKEAYERRTKLKEVSEEETFSESSLDYEMTRQRTKKSKGRQRKVSNSSSSSKDVKGKSSKKQRRQEKRSEADQKSTSSTITVGRQTNNSLSAATGQILIQPPPNTNKKKKLKTSQVFRQTDEDLQTGMHKILDFVQNHEDAWPFADPVEEEYAPNYYSIIRKPMDLQRMEERLDAGYYKSYSKFRTDFQLIVDNCRLYNGVENEYTEMVDNLLEVFERATEKYLDQISSSDDEIAIEYTNMDPAKSCKRRKSEEIVVKRKPMLAAQTPKKRERSLSADSVNSRSSYESFDKVDTKCTKIKKVEKGSKKQAKSNKTKKDKDSKKHKNDLKKEKGEIKKDKAEIKKEKTETKKEKVEVKQEKIESKREKTENKKEKIEVRKEKIEIKKEKTETKREKIEVKKEKVENKIEKVENKKEKVENKKEKVESRKEKVENKKEKVENKKAKVDNKKGKFENKKEKVETKKEKVDNKREKSENNKDNKKVKPETKENDKAGNNKVQKDRNIKSKKSNKKTKKRSPVRSRSPSRSQSLSPPPRSDLSSPPPSWPPSSPELRFDFNPKKNSKKRHSCEMSESEEPRKGKQKKCSKEDFLVKCEDEFPIRHAKLSEYPVFPLSPKPKDKHNKLRETIEKLKAKSEIKLKDEFSFDLDRPKENKDKNRKQEKEDKAKPKVKEKTSTVKPVRSDVDLELEGNSTMDSVMSDSKKAKKTTAKITTSISKPASNLDALSIATEQTLKDINKWLDDTPKFSEFSSASNSPSYTGLDEFDVIANKIEQIPGKKVDKPPGTKKEGGARDIKKRPFRDPSKFFKRREVQRTIDRLQPGKSKGNLISNVQNTNKVDEMFPLGPLSKIKDTKNSLIVKTDTNAPKLSLGSVLDSFGKHNFVDDQKREEQKILVELPKQENSVFTKDSGNAVVKDVTAVKNEISEVKEDKKEKESTVDDSGGGATPNLSAWFKAFGAPKVQPPQKKCDLKPDGKENEKCDESSSKSAGKVPVPIISPNTDSPIMPQGQPVPRQRKISTGSSMSERSSFSQDMDSPRVGMDERGAYPAPYPSPLHRSPSGASPVMASPRPDISPKAAAYPTINGQIRCGFYQDTVSNKSSPDKSCSPRENPQSPYPHYSEHIYTPNTTENSYYSYANSPYYTHPPNYSSTNPTPPYNMEGSSSYYDTSKSLTDQYQAKSLQNYTANSPASNQSSPAHPQLSPSIHSPHSPIIHPQHSPGVNSQNSPGVLSPHSPGIYPQHSPNILPQHSPNVHPANSPSIHPQLSPNVQPHGSPVVQHSPNVQMQNSPSMHSPGGIQPKPSPNLPAPSPSVPIPEVESFQSQESKLADKQQSAQSATFPVKKRAYNEDEALQIGTQRYEIDPKLSERESSRNAAPENLPPPEISTKEEQEKQETVETSSQSLTSNVISASSSQQTSQVPVCTPSLSLDTSSLNFPNPTNPNSFSSSFGNSDSNYPLNIPNARNLGSAPQNKIDLSKYTNMGYTGPDVNYTRALQQLTRPEISGRATVPTSIPQKPAQVSSASTLPSSQTGDTRLRYNNPNTSLQQMGYKSADLTSAVPQQAHNNYASNARSNSVDKLLQNQEIPTVLKPDVTVPRPAYTSPSVDVDQSLGLGRTVSNLSHIVDRFAKDDLVMSGLQGSSSFYPDKALGTSQLFNKPSTSALPMFSQANMAAMQSYSQGVQGTTSMYGRQIADMQNPAVMQNEPKVSLQAQIPEKKSKKRKSTKNAAASNSGDTQQSSTTHQGFQSYAGLKGNSSIEPSAISLKTSSVVPGSAFNFGPTPSALGISPSLYSDKDAYPNFLDEFRSTPNYYMAAAAAAHHRSTPETSEKQTRAAHQNSNPQTTPGFPFLGAPPQARPTYPIGGPFIPNAQAQLMDTSSPLYQHYLQAGVLNQGLLGPPGAYPPGYHPALSIRQPYDSMTRPSWL